MDEQTLQNLKYLLINPYTWLFILFTLSLPYLFQYIRRFFPKKLQEKMAKEEACALEHNKKPEIKRMHKNMRIGILVSFIISLIVSYFSKESLSTFRIVFASMLGMVALYSIVIEQKIKKDKIDKNKNCSNIYSKHEFFTMIGIYGGLVALLMFIIVYFEIGRIR